jgi:hypothetical protein
MKVEKVLKRVAGTEKLGKSGFWISMKCVGEVGILTIAPAHIVGVIVITKTA